MRDKSRSGRPANAVTPTMVVNVRFFVNKDHRVTLQETANQFSIGKALAHQTLLKKDGNDQGKC